MSFVRHEFFLCRQYLTGWLWPRMSGLHRKIVALFHCGQKGVVL